MANITNAQIQELRVKTNAGMMDCKRALQECNGDMEQAADLLRKKGIAKASKRSEREAREGIIKILLNTSKDEAYMVELNSETDFVSRNENFQNLAGELLKLLEKNKSKDMETFAAVKYDSKKTVKDAVDELGGVIGEKIILNRIYSTNVSANDCLGAYVHSNNKIGVIVNLINGKGNEDLAKDISMHIAASNPSGISVNDIPAADIAKEKEVLRTQIINEGKPENMADKIVEGKIRKYYEEVCLLEQNFVKDPNVKVKDILAEASKKAGKNVSVKSFIRFAIG
ncbi:MAG: translation elongation factor Ts [Candidatus Margulisbacteria bacterium]|nr:translation elongation factor Ts [Candidatus Margulisiibacteriota bacterium]